MASSVFVSYKRDHTVSEALVRQLEADFAASGIQLLRDQSMTPGARWSKQLYEWLLQCDAGIAIVSRDANTADWCRREWSVLAARSEAAGLPVFPVHVDGEIITTGILDELQAIQSTPDTIARLKTELERLPVRAPNAHDFLALHQAWLRWQFRENPVLGKEPYTLADVYVDTECGTRAWGDINTGGSGSGRDPFLEKNGGREELVETVLRYMATPAEKFRDLIVVQAGPGSGKSAFTLRLANELMALGFTPILVRFRDLRLATFPDVAELIDDAIRIGHSDETSPSSTEPIVAKVLGVSRPLRGTPICQTVFIFDGWDEVSLTGNVTYQAQLQQWLPRLREFFTMRRGDPVRVLLTGRPSSEVGQSGVLLKSTPVLTLRPIQPDQLRVYAARIKERLDAIPAPPWHIDLDRLELVFDEYERWFAPHQEGEQSSTGASAEVLGNPLLAYLSLRVIAESKQNPKDLLQEPTALYHELIETTVAYAGKGDAGVDHAVHRGGRELRRLLHEVASTITILRGETVSFSELEARFNEPGLPIPRDLLKGWTNTASTGSALQELVVNFYFKGGNTALGCEFLHKSFREYLFAEAVLFALTDAVSRRTEPDTQYDGIEYWQDFLPDSNAFVLSRRLAYLFGAQWMSREVRGHLRWLIRRAAQQNSEQWAIVRDLTTDVYVWWAEGAHLRHQPTGSRRARWNPPFVNELFEQTAPFDASAEFTPSRSTALDAHLGEALLQITAFLHAERPEGRPVERGHRAGYQSFDGGRLRLRPGRGGFLRQLVARIDGAGWRSTDGLGGMVLDNVDISGENLSGLTLTYASFRGAVMRDALLIDCDLASADLSDADLQSAHLSNAGMQSARLNGATLHGTRFYRAMLQGAYFAGARLNGADFTDADLTSADLTNADLTAVGLDGARLERARVSESSLRMALSAKSTSGQPDYIENEAGPPVAV